MNKFKFMYDKEADSLVVFREDRQNHASIKFGEIIIDLDKNMNVSAIEILNPDLLYKIPKEKLSKISEASVQIQHRGQLFWIFVSLKFERAAKEQIEVPLELERPISV
ncbi:MAG: DUF2283 domain-containing protein [Candidatus Aenigmarchaeota archaeon]|nr:DUF2283 domain-containing protein [Candidatus Aenigmarchaeota archaeon]